MGEGGGLQRCGEAAGVDRLGGVKVEAGVMKDVVRVGRGGAGRGGEG